MLCLISHDATYGNCAALAEGLRTLAPLKTVFFQKDLKELYKQTPCQITKTIPKADHYIVVGAISMRKLPSFVWKDMTAILTDSTYLFAANVWNKKLKGVNVWAMPDLAELAGTDKIYYQPFVLPELNVKKTELICHTPFHPSKMIEKGTDRIVEACRNLGYPITVVLGKTWKETIDIKAKHEICIDQIYRGLGKSGLEAMLLGCATIAGVKPKLSEAPAVWTNEENLEEDILRTIKNKHEIAKKQRLWAEHNLNPIKTAKKILGSTGKLLNNLQANSPEKIRTFRTKRW